MRFLNPYPLSEGEKLIVCSRLSKSKVKQKKIFINSGKVENGFGKFETETEWKSEKKTVSALLLN